MKKRILTIGLSLVTVMAFSQKKEIRNAEDAVEEGNYSAAKSLLKQVESKIAGEKDRVKEDYYLVKAKAFLGAENGTNTSLEDLTTAAAAYQKLEAVGGDEELVAQGMLTVRNAMVNSAIADQKKKDYSKASDKLFKSYQLGKQDTVYLFYAASNSVNAKDYDNALKYYNKLMELGYDGAEPQYMATNAKTGEVKAFGSESERDIYVKTGEYVKPEVQMSPSKTGEIAKNIVLLYTQMEKPEMAMKAMQKAKEENPDDIDLLKVEANMYYTMGKIDRYNQLMKEIVMKDPENPTLYYNLAVTTSQLGDDEAAIEYYKKAIEHDPEMLNAYVNLAATILKGESDLLEEMNQALEKGDNAKYDELSSKRKGLYTEALPYLEKAHQLKPEGVEVIRTMMNINYVLGNNEKAKELQAKMKAMGEE